jgi:LacI family transcriptional regulator
MKNVLMLLNSYDTDTHKGIAGASKELGWNLHVGTLATLRSLKKWKGNGIICSLGDSNELVNFVTQANVSTVNLSLSRKEITYPCVTADHVCIGNMAAEHFCNFGHSNFAWFSNVKSHIAQLRLQGFEDKLLKQGKSAPSALSGPKAQDEGAVLRWLETLKRPCAIFTFNDLNAAWLLNLCLDNGYEVPKDFAILGVDNDPLICDYQIIPLSSVNHAHERIGYEGAYLLDEIMNGHPLKEMIRLIEPTGVTLRDSTDIYAASDPIVQAAIEYILSHLRKPIGTIEIADALGVSRRNLEIRFQESLNCSVHKKLIEVRLKAAEHMLVNTDRTIEDIASLTGFCHAPHLSHTFKNAFGLPPRTYRKNHLETV